MISINTRQTGNGHYNVIVTKDFEQIGAFQTTDMDLVEDIHEMNRHFVYDTGFESHLSDLHDTFEEVEEKVLSLLKN